MNFKSKHCSVCGELYTPTGRCSKYCTKCSIEKYKEQQREAQYKYREKHGHKTRVGSGSLTGTGVDNPMYRHGRCTFRRWAKEKKELLGCCEHCGKDLSQAGSNEWVGHHKDHNPTNNIESNLIILCKSCHQIEHECWKSFEGVTTIPQGSRVDNNSKRLAPDMGDDIVCSA